MRTELVRDMSATDYHNDPCEVPSLSQSIAHVLDRQSPLHAYMRHPKLGGVPREPMRAFDYGTLAHKMLLGRGRGLVRIDADDWRTKAAREQRDEASARGLVGVLECDYQAVEKAVPKIRERLAAFDVSFDNPDDSEVTAFWSETTTEGDAVQCRGMLDHVKLPTVYELKSARSAHPESCMRHIEGFGYAIQRAAYVSALEKIHPEWAGRVDYVFVFVELFEPYAVTPLRISGAFRELGERRWRRAVSTWARCLRENQWPGYVDHIIEVEPPPWALRAEMDRQMAAAMETWSEGEDIPL